MSDEIMNASLPKCFFDLRGKIALIGWIDSQHLTGVATTYYDKCYKCVLWEYCNTLFCHMKSLEYFFLLLRDLEC